MSAKEQRRQKKLAKKRSKELMQKKSAAREKNLMRSLAGQVQAGSKGAIERCLVSDSLLDEDQKFGSVLISRKLHDGRVIFVRYLVDGMCLGIKDASVGACFPGDLSGLIERISEAEPLTDASPAAMKKMVLSVVDFAEKLGFQPHPVFKKTFALWDGVDTQECSQEFEFGVEGKPHFISGPYDTASSVASAMLTLDRSVGEGNYEFTINRGGGMEDDDDFSDQFSPLIDDRELDVDIDEDVPII